MERYLLTIFVTVDQETAIRGLFLQQGWTLLAKKEPAIKKSSFLASFKHRRCNLDSNVQFTNPTHNVKEFVCHRESSSSEGTKECVDGEEKAKSKGLDSYDGDVHTCTCEGSVVVNGPFGKGSSYNHHGRDISLDGKFIQESKTKSNSEPEELNISSSWEQNPETLNTSESSVEDPGRLDRTGYSLQDTETIDSARFSLTKDAEAVDVSIVKEEDTEKACPVNNSEGEEEKEPEMEGRKWKPPEQVHCEMIGESMFIKRGSSLESDDFCNSSNSVKIEPMDTEQMGENGNLKKVPELAPDIQSFDKHNEENNHALSSKIANVVKKSVKQKLNDTVFNSKIAYDKKCEAGSTENPKVGSDKKSDKAEKKDLMVRCKLTGYINKTAANKKFYCEECDRYFAHEKKYLNHAIDGKCRFDCGYCGKVFTSLCYGKYKQHLKRHMGIKSAQCDICNKKFHDHHHMELHKTTHAGLTYTCQLCGNEFKSRYTLDRHRRIEHEGRKYNSRWKEKVPCEICGESFTLGHIQTHVQVVHMNDCPVECPECKKHFPSARRLRMHVKNVHGGRKYQCEICARLYKTQSALNIHYKTHSDVYEFPCETCGKGFHSRHDLMEHVRTHTGERPYKCDYCDYKCAIKGNMRFHLRTHGIVNTPLKST